MTTIMLLLSSCMRATAWHRWLLQWLRLYARLFCSIFLLFASCAIYAQQDSGFIPSDTALLTGVTVTAFASGLKWKDVPASVAVLNKQQLMKYDGTSLVPVLNTVAGVRMEERSPGSYRLSMRGSLLRSPFGVRNVKIYLDDIPLTDATGNTYLNLIDINELKSVEIIKGPSASFYGANTGGTLLLNTDDVPGIEAGLSGGSYGLLKEYVSLKQHTDKAFLSLQQSHMQSDGYRQQSALRRDVIQSKLKLRLSPGTSLSFFAFYSNLHYETPGGITQQQMDSLSKLARQPAGPVPGAITQDAGIYNKTYFAATTFRSAFAKNFSNTTSLVVNHTDFRNPFITNFEKRREWNYSGRTNFQYAVSPSNTFSLKADAGAELQYNNSYIRVYDNNEGQTGNNQYRDKVHTTQYFLFAQLSLGWNKLLLQAGVSNNNLRYWYERLHDAATDSSILKETGNTVSPRIGITYAIDKTIAFYASAAKGFSTPTLAEVLPSTGLFTQTLQAEYGWNYEAGIKGATLNNRLQFNLSCYYFALKDAIVRRNDNNGIEYFVNAGGTIQKGAELWFSINIIRNHIGFIRSLDIWNSFAYQPYRFDNYKLGEDEFSGNKLTGVPRTTNISGADGRFSHGWSVNLLFNYTSSIPLNDGGTAFADPYHLLQAKLSKVCRIKKVNLSFFAGADNLLNDVYSLGNDINAFGGRFYNPAAARNYYGGVTVTL